MDVEDDLKINPVELEEQGPEEELKSQRRKRLAVAISGIFLAALVVVYLVPGNYVLSVIEGQVTSYKLNPDFTVDLKGSRVIFNETAYSELKKLYFAEQENEFKVCLDGKKEGQDYYVYGLHLPRTFSQGLFHVSSEFCNGNTIIEMHTHPYKHCTFSYQDVKSYNALQKINPDAIIGLMCEPDRFNFYGY